MEYFSCRHPTGLALDEETARILEFLENDELTVISAVHNKEEDTIKFHHRIPNDEISLLFYKIPQVGGGGGGSGGNGRGGSSGHATTNTSNVRLDKHQPLGILTLEGGLVKSIYNSVSRVFSPHANVRVCLITESAFYYYLFVNWDVQKM